MILVLVTSMSSTLALQLISGHTRTHTHTHLTDGFLWSFIVFCSNAKAVLEDVPISHTSGEQLLNPTLSSCEAFSNPTNPTVLI